MATENKLSAQDKKTFVETQMTQFWDFCNEAMSTYNSYPVVPDSVQEFSESFLIRLRELVEVL